MSDLLTDARRARAALAALCPRCGRPVPPCEAAAYGGRHEDCSVPDCVPVRGGLRPVGGRGKRRRVREGWAEIVYGAFGHGVER